MDALAPVKAIQCLLENEWSAVEFLQHGEQNDWGGKSADLGAATAQLSDEKSKLEGMLAFLEEAPDAGTTVSYVKTHVKPAACGLLRALISTAFTPQMAEALAMNRRYAAYFQLVLNHFHAVLLEGNMYENSVLAATFGHDGRMRSGALHLYAGLLEKMEPLFGPSGNPSCQDAHELDSYQIKAASSLEGELGEQRTQSSKVFQSLSRQVYPLPAGEGAALASFYREVVHFFEENSYNPCMSSPNPLGAEVFESIFREMRLQLEVLVARTQGKAPLRGDDVWFLKLVVEQVLPRIEFILAKGCPYVESLDLVESVVTLFDVDVRAARVSAECNLRFHHTEWWLYGLPHLKFVAPREGFIVIPTTATIGTTDLIKWKALPFGIIQVPFDVLYVDRYLQTPMEFLVHDYQHARRHWWETYLNIYATQFNVTRDREFGPPSAYFEAGDEAPLHFSRSDWLGRVEELIRDETTPIMAKLMKMIKLQDFKSLELAHLSVSRLPEAAQEEERNLRRLVKFLIFEIHHEENEPYATEKMQDVLRRAPGGQIDFIYQRVRMAKDDDSATYPLRIDYGHKQPVGGTALAIGYRKLNTNFYSQYIGNDLEDFFPPREFVTPQNMALAAARLWDEVTGYPDRWSLKGKDYVPREDLVVAFTTRTADDSGATASQWKEWGDFLKKHNGLEGAWKSSMRSMDPEECYISAEEQFLIQERNSIVVPAGATIKSGTTAATTRAGRVRCGAWTQRNATSVRRSSI